MDHKSNKVLMPAAVDVAGVENNIAYYSDLIKHYEALLIELRACRRVWRGQLAPARRLEKKARTEALPKRPRGRPFKPNALTTAERQRRYKERKLQKLLESLSSTGNKG